MKGNLLKKLNEKTPDFVKKALSKPIRAKVIKNKVFLDEYKELQQYESYSDEDKRKVHFAKVKDVLIYAYENTDYYKEQFNCLNFSPYDLKDLSELDKLPTINKQQVIENYNKIISRKEIDHYAAYTGGSTGKPLKILLDTNSIYKEKAFVYYYWSKFGYDYSKSKIITFRGLEFKDKLYKYNPIDNQIILNPFLLNKNTINKYVDRINKYKPDLIHGYCSAIYNFCKLLKSSGLKLSCNIQSVCFISENVEEKQRIFIEETLNCTSNIFYGHSERIVFAEYYKDSYKFNDLYTHVDFINTDQKDIYKMACTGFVSRKMPLIRYTPDDVAIIKDGNIEIHGHWDKELLIGTNNEQISIASINFHNDVFSKVRMYQFEQYKSGEVYLNILEDKKLDKKDINDIENIINSKLKNVIDIKIRIVEDIELTNRGKYKKIKQHIK